MMMLTRIKLATLDKKITGLLKQSRWLDRYRSADPETLSFMMVDRSEPWVREVETFADTVWNEKGYRRLLEAAGMRRPDIVDVFLAMTVSTLPDPIFRTGPSNLSNTLVGSAMYQEVDKQLAQFLHVWRQHNNPRERRDHEAIADFAFRLKTVHDASYGKMTLEMTLS
jgi:hypothetical protein